MDQKQLYDVTKDNLEEVLNHIKIGNIPPPYEAPAGGKFQDITLSKGATEIKIISGNKIVKKSVKSNEVILKFPCTVSNIKYTSKQKKEGNDKGKVKDDKLYLTSCLRIKNDTEEDKEFNDWFTNHREKTRKIGYVDFSDISNFFVKIEGFYEKGQCYYLVYNDEEDSEVSFYNSNKTEKQDKYKFSKGKEDNVFILADKSAYDKIEKNQKEKKGKKENFLLEVQYDWKEGFLERLRKKIALLLINGKLDVKNNSDKNKNKIEYSCIKVEEEEGAINHVEKVSSGIFGKGGNSRTAFTYIKREDDGTILDISKVSSLIYSDVKDYKKTTRMINGKEVTFDENRAKFNYKGKTYDIDKVIEMSEKYIFDGIVYLRIKCVRGPIADQSTDKLTIKMYLDSMDIHKVTDRPSSNSSDELRDEYQGDEDEDNPFLLKDEKKTFKVEEKEEDEDVKITTSFEKMDIKEEKTFDNELDDE